MTVNQAEVKIMYLNHACIKLSYQNVNLLIDPWLLGTCFEDGWGLRYDNPSALFEIKDCTHLWISHFHQDHFHRPTLKYIKSANPKIHVLGNDSFNFKINKAVEKLGFQNVTAVHERKPIKLGDGVSITRYPTKGIDNMLLIKLPGMTILNFNDCRIPPMSQKMLKKKFGAIDVYLSNFNHAGKLLSYPMPTAQSIKQKLKENFLDSYKVFDPKYVLPFASYHYYRAPESFKQNDAMLDGSELEGLDQRILPWRIGDTVTFENGKVQLIRGNSGNKNELVHLQRKQHYTIEQLTAAANNFSTTLRKRFGFFTRFIPGIVIQLSDQNTNVEFKPSKGIIKEARDLTPHIVCHSQALYSWFSKPFGTDSFVVGAHFDIVNNNRIPLKWQLVLGLLVDNQLDLRSGFRMLFRRSGIKFLYNRREELIGSLFQFRLTANYHQDD